MKDLDGSPPLYIDLGSLYSHDLEDALVAQQTVGVECIDAELQVAVKPNLNRDSSASFVD